MSFETILIAGPTASGKSAFAIQLAQARKKNDNCIIINTDSMQVYRQLQIITARPHAEDMALVPHALYGCRDGNKPYSVASWLADVKDLLEEIKRKTKCVIFVGGTGLYFKALCEGLSPVPEPDPHIRRKWREFGKFGDGGCENGAKDNLLYRELLKRDKQAAAILRAGDHQRIIRALEVIDSTGKSILEWQKADRGNPVIGPDCLQKMLLMPERSLLHERINNRFDNMVELGGVDEVNRLLQLNIDPTLPIMKAIGVPQFKNYLEAKISLEEAIQSAKAATRQYAKRQSTWFNNQFGDEWRRL